MTRRRIEGIPVVFQVFLTKSGGKRQREICIGILRMEY